MQNLDSRPNAFFTALCFTVSKESFKKEHILHQRMKTNIKSSMQSNTEVLLFTWGTACPRPSTSMLVFSPVPSTSLKPCFLSRDDDGRDADDKDKGEEEDGDVMGGY